ncbi:hypothetical protein COOONC_18654 [Cooperia oncophora]
MILHFLALISIGLAATSLPSLETYLNKYRPKVVTEGTRTVEASLFRVHIYPKNRIETTLSFGASDDVIRAAETAINDFYSGELLAQGDETEKMGERVLSDNGSSRLGDSASVAKYLTHPSWHTTGQSLRRSPSFVMFDVNGRGIAFAKEGGIRP